MGSPSTARDPRRPFTSIVDEALPARDPIIGYIKVGGKESRERYARGTGRPWVGPTRFAEPARFEVVTREKDIRQLKGQKGSGAEAKTFSVDFGFKRDERFHERIGDPAPTVLRGWLYYPTPVPNLVSFFGTHDGKRWICQGNGAEALDVTRGECPCPCPRLKQFDGEYAGTAPFDGKKRDGTPKPLLPCKPRATLVLLLKHDAAFPAFRAFKTTSFESIANIRKALEDLHRVYNRLDGLPVELRVMAATKAFDDQGGKTTQPIVTLSIAGGMDAARQLAAGAAEEARKYLPVIPTEEADQIQEALVVEMQEDVAGYAGEYDPETVVAEADSEDDDDGPDHEVVEEEEEDDDSDRNDETEGGPPEEAPLERVCRDVLAEAGWTEEAINGRIEYQLRPGGKGLQILADYLRDTMPEAWAKVTQGDLLGAAPPDGLEL